MWGGLGNQMFIYSLFKSMCNKGIKAKLDMSWFDYYSMHNGYELATVFGAKIVEATRKEVNQYANIKIGKINKLLKKTVHKKTQLLYGGHDAVTYHPEIFRVRNKYIEGYWQCEKYFLDTNEAIRSIFTFPVETIESLLKETAFYKEFKSNKYKSSIHIRRGDYILNKPNTARNRIHKFFPGKCVNLGGVCTESYYSNAINYLEKRTDKAHYYIFSNDVDWCKTNLRLPEKRHTFVDINTKENSYVDMYLMSQCNHNIIANSSFSWWGAWLNSHDDKIVVAPDRWFQDGYLGDIIPEDWVKLPTE